DLFGEEVEVICIKGSGADLSSIEPAQFPAVRLGFMRKLRARSALADSDLLRVQRQALLDQYAPNPSVELLLHAFLPHKFVDHTHADIALVLTNQPRDEAEAMVREAFGPRWAIVPYVMPGFALAKLAAEVYERHPSADGVVLLS